MQIRKRLTFQFMAIAAGILALTHVAVYSAYRRHMENVFFSGLETQIDVAVQTTLFQADRFRPTPQLNSGEDPDEMPFHDNISIFNDAYQRVFSMKPEAAPVGERTLSEVAQTGMARFKHGNLDGLGMAKQAPSGRPYLVVAEGFCDPSDLEKLRNILIFSLLIGIAAAAVGSWFMAGQALKPIKRIVGEVEEIRADDLSRRLETGASGDELARLAAAFNRLLNRVEAAFQMQKQFVSNVSHELKNPLTIIRTQLDVSLQRERSPEEYRAAMHSVLDDVTSLTEVGEKLLQLARIHSDSAGIQLAEIRVDEVLWSARELALKNHPGGRVSLDFQDFPENENALNIPANEALLRTAFLNLIENGLKYSPDKLVRVRMVFGEKGIRAVEVADNGPGISPEEAARILQPFYRSARHRNVKGTGIGLSLTESILRAHGFRLEIGAAGNPPSPKATAGKGEVGTVFRVVFSEN